SDDGIVSRKCRHDQAIDALTDEALYQRGLPLRVVVRIADQRDIANIGKAILDCPHDRRMHRVAEIGNDDAYGTRALRAKPRSQCICAIDELADAGFAT